MYTCQNAWKSGFSELEPQFIYTIAWFLFNLKLQSAIFSVCAFCVRKGHKGFEVDRFLKDSGTIFCRSSAFLAEINIFSMFWKLVLLIIPYVVTWHWHHCHHIKVMVHGPYTSTTNYARLKSWAENGKLMWSQHIILITHYNIQDLCIQMSVNDSWKDWTASGHNEKEG